MSLLFSPVRRPAKVVPDSTLDEELARSTEDADLTLYFVNMVVISASELANKDFMLDKSDPYCEVAIGGIMDTTPTVQNDLNPVWNESMSFFLPTQPDAMELRVWDRNTMTKDDSLGVATFVFDDKFWQMDTPAFEGELSLLQSSNNKDNGNKAPEKKTRARSPSRVVRLKKCGSLRIHVRGRTLRPIETEVKLNHVGRQLQCKVEEQEGTVKALDESERLRQDAIEQLNIQEQRVLQKAKDLEESQQNSASVLSEKDKQILEQAQLVEDKVQEMEEAYIAKREIELQRQEVQTKLTKAELDILEKSNQLEETRQHTKEKLTAKERELMDMSKLLRDRQKRHEQLEIRLEQMESLKSEVQNELTSSERILLEHKKRYDKQLSDKEQELVIALQERDKAAQEAQRQQNATEQKLAPFRQQNEKLQTEIKSLTGNMTSVGDTAREVQQELDMLKVRNENLEKKNARLEHDLMQIRLLLEQERATSVHQQASCNNFLSEIL